MFMSHIILVAIQRNNRMNTALFPHVSRFDILTPEDLLNVLKNNHVNPEVMLKHE